MRIVDEERQQGIPCTLCTPTQLHAATGALAARIITLLAAHPKGLHAAAIARELRVPEQNIHYHTRKLRKAGILTLDRIEDTAGAAAKVLALPAPGLATAYAPLTPWTPKAHNPAHARFLAPFIRDGTWDARIVVSSPDPHGPASARGRDAGYAIDLGLFLGHHTRSAPAPSMQFDTDELDWQQHLIVIGGPVVNRAAQQLPTAYDDARKAFIVHGKEYAQDNVGIIMKMPNPKAKGKWILLLAGKRYTGTRAAVLAFLQRFDELCARMDRDGRCTVVVEGLDADSDGNIESVRLLA